MPIDQDRRLQHDAEPLADRLELLDHQMAPVQRHAKRNPLALGRLSSNQCDAN
jgi:hypothetical protein